MSIWFSKAVEKFIPFETSFCFSSNCTFLFPFEVISTCALDSPTKSLDPSHIDLTSERFDFRNSPRVSRIFRDTIAVVSAFDFRHLQSAPLVARKFGWCTIEDVLWWREAILSKGRKDERFLNGQPDAEPDSSYCRLENWKRILQIEEEHRKLDHHSTSVQCSELLMARVSIFVSNPRMSWFGTACEWLYDTYNHQINHSLSLCESLSCHQCIRSRHRHSIDQSQNRHVADLSHKIGQSKI